MVYYMHACTHDCLTDIDMTWNIEITYTIHSLLRPFNNSIRIHWKLFQWTTNKLQQLLNICMLSYLLIKMCHTYEMLQFQFHCWNADKKEELIREYNWYYFTSYIRVFSLFIWIEKGSLNTKLQITLLCLPSNVHMSWYE